MDEDLRSASDSVGDLPAGDNHLKPTKKSGGKAKKALLTLLTLLLLAILVFGVWRFAFKPDQKPTPSASESTPAASEASQVQKKDVPEAAATEAFKSTTLGLQFDYPKTWTITEKEGGVRAESLAFEFEKESGSAVNGYFRIYIRKGARDIDGKYIGSGVAVIESEKLVYTKPAPGQRTETLISNFGQDESNKFTFFMIAGNFQLKSGDTLGPDYGKEPDAFIVGGGYSSKDLTDDLAFNSVPLDYYSTTNAYTQAIDIVKSLQLR